MNKSINLIAISGKKQHGKNTVADMIGYFAGKHNMEGEFEEYRSFMNKNRNNLTAPNCWNGRWVQKLFADKLKDIVCLLIGCTRDQLEDDIFKNTPLGEEWDKWETPSTTQKYLSNSDYELLSENQKGWCKKVQLTPRLMLQLIGTEGLRDLIHPNVHVNALFADYVGIDKNREITPLDPWEFPKWIITDCRFLNEVEAVKERSGIVIRVENPRKISTDMHPSEISLDDYKEFDYTISNDGTIDELLEKVKLMMIVFNLMPNDN